MSTSQDLYCDVGRAIAAQIRLPRVVPIHTHAAHIVRSDTREARRMIFLPGAVLHNNESLDVLSRGRHLV